MATDYITSSELKAARDMSGYTYADADISRAITAASRAIDSMCRRRFYLDADATQVRYYTARRGDLVDIDDIVTVTSILTDNNNDGVYEDTWTVGTDYRLEPLNAVADGLPYTQLIRNVSGSRWLPLYGQAIKVTGQFGWPAVPAPITQATLILATRYLTRSREATFGVLAVGNADAAMRISRTDPDVYELIRPYMNTIPIL